jgi:hypothetical protein
MDGIDFDRTYAALKAPDDRCIETVIAIGKLGRKGSLLEKLQALELPNSCELIANIALERGF